MWHDSPLAYFNGSLPCMYVNLTQCRVCISPAIPAEFHMISGSADSQTSADVSSVGKFQLPDPAVCKWRRLLVSLSHGHVPDDPGTHTCLSHCSGRHHFLLRSLCRITGPCRRRLYVSHFAGPLPRWPRRLRPELGAAPAPNAQYIARHGL